MRLIFCVNLYLRSVDYINDITAELRQLLGSGALPPQERLRVLLTAAETVQSQASWGMPSGALPAQHLLGCGGHPAPHHVCACALHT